MQGCGELNEEVKKVHKIDIYIETKYEGNFACGKGSYSILLELIDKDNNPLTREHFGGYLETTNNRLCILSIINALKCVKKPCEIEIHINNGYVAGVINNDRLNAWEESGWISTGKEIKNADLWQQYIKHSENHLIYITAEKENSYTKAMIFMLGTQKINYITDYRKENEYV